MKAYFAKGREIYDVTLGNSKRIHINNFGYYRELAEEIRTVRPHGRKDYHLLYVASGEMEVEGTRLTPGEFYLYLPDTPQDYAYLPGEKSLYYWIHFTGYGVQAFLREAGLSGGLHAETGRKSRADDLLRLLADALSRDGEIDPPYAGDLLFALLRLLAAPSVQRYPFPRAVKALEQLEEPVCVEALAQSYRMSRGHFIRSFRAAYGVTPGDYRTRARIRLAQNLLEDTELSVCRVSEQCGFSDPLYFSRLFKKRTGLSPTEFRRARRDDLQNFNIK